MSQFNHLFAKCAKLARPAYMPFLMLGTPNIETSLAIIEGVIQGGADALELGIPFSDPIADGPTIQQSAQIALNQGVTPHDCLNMIKTIKQKHPHLPIGLLVYANLIFQQGISNFYQLAKQADVDSVLIPDVPTIEAAPFIKAARQHDIDPILLATTSCQTEDFAEIAKLSRGYTYIVTRKGVTGTQTQSAFRDAQAISQQLIKVNAPPGVFGFGIKKATDVQAAFKAGAKGVIIGSALIEQLNQLSLNKLQETAVVAKLTRKLFSGV